MAITVAPVSLQHVPGYHACLDVVAREKRYLAQIEALPLERFSDLVHSSVANDAVQFMALDGQQVVGWADVFPAWAHAVAHCGSLGMGLLPAYRGRGIGQLLLQACLDKAGRKGISRVTLEVRADNVGAIKLYKKMGFAHEALMRRAMRFDGVYFDALLMSRLASA